MYRGTVGHGRQFGNHHGGNPKHIACTTDFQSGRPMAVRVHVPPVAVRKVCAVGDVTGRRHRAAGGSAGAAAARARSPPRSRDDDSERHFRRGSVSGGSRRPLYTDVEPVGCDHRPDVPRKLLPQGH
jgi:hypothetical protein